MRNVTPIRDTIQTERFLLSGRAPLPFADVPNREDDEGNRKNPVQLLVQKRTENEKDYI